MYEPQINESDSRIQNIRISLRIQFSLKFNMEFWRWWNLHCC